MEEIEMWKNVNGEEYDQLTTNEKAQEFKTLMTVIKGVLQMREDIQESNNEIEDYANMLQKESVNNLASKAVAQGQESSQKNQVHQPNCSKPSSTSNKVESKSGSDEGLER